VILKDDTHKIDQEQQHYYEEKEVGRIVENSASECVAATTHPDNERNCPKNQSNDGGNFQRTCQKSNKTPKREACRSHAL